MSRSQNPAIRKYPMGTAEDPRNDPNKDPRNGEGGRRGLAIVMANYIVQDFPENRELVKRYEKMYLKMGFLAEDIIMSTDLQFNADKDEVFVEKLATEKDKSGKVVKIRYEYSTGPNPMRKDHLFTVGKKKKAGNTTYNDPDQKGDPNDPRVMDGLTAEGMIIFVRKTVEQYQAKYKFETADCVSLAVMSHGGKDNNVGRKLWNQASMLDMVCGSDGKLVFFGIEGKHLGENVAILEPFKQDDVAKGLKGKPKIIFIDACRGNQTETLLPMGGQGSGLIHPPPQPEEGDTPLMLPSESDWIRFYSSAPSYVSYYNDASGSILSRQLTDFVISEDLSTMHLADMLPVVLEMVIVAAGRIKDKKTGKPCLVVPSIVSQLRMQVWFKLRALPASQST